LWLIDFMWMENKGWGRLLMHCWVQWSSWPTCWPSPSSAWLCSPCTPCTFTRASSGINVFGDTYLTMVPTFQSTHMQGNFSLPSPTLHQP
jgi:hypothetical protein